MDDRPLLLVVHDWTREPWVARHGPEAAPNAKQVDWTFTVWAPENHYRLFAGTNQSFSDHPNFRQPVPAPRIDVYLDRDSPIAWDEVEVPANVRVIDTRGEAAPGDLGASGVIRGGVFDMATHQVIVGADVVLSRRIEGRQWKKDAGRAKTDENGYYDIQAIPEGYYVIHVGADGYAARKAGVFHNRNGHVQLDFDVLLMKTVSCEGIVEDTEGNPIPDVTVYARDTLGIDGYGYGYECSTAPRAQTNEEGRFELHSLPSGYTRIRSRAPSLHQKTPGSTIYDISVKPWRDPQLIRIVMSGTGIVRGTVVGMDGKPPTRPFIAEIEPKSGSKIGSWGGSMQCKKDGSFEFKGVPPGEYVVHAKPNPMREGEASEPKLVTITVGGIEDLHIPHEYAHRSKGR